jgi:two-component system, OmpR family, copper resistance phosphate regulon response regulator CusR
MELLVVEDEPKVAALLDQGLKEQGYGVTIAYDGETGLRLAKSGKFQLIVLDVNLPYLNGLELCRILRESDDATPVIMLTALGMSDDIVSGLEAGADDYMTKPFKFTELFARIKALTRRASSPKIESTDEGEVFRLGDLKIAYDGRQVFRGNKEITLTAREYALLVYLAKNKGKVRTRQEIAEKVWDLNFDTGTNFIDVYVSYLRNKMDKPFESRLIHTVVGIGYVLKE